MRGKGIVVTGGASGLGLATCKLLVGRGAWVAIIDADRGTLESALAAVAQRVTDRSK